jgi:hypothetical protein
MTLAWDEREFPTKNFFGIPLSKILLQRVYCRVNLPSYALHPENDTAVGAHCGCAGQGLEMDPRSRSRLVERTAVGEGG